MLKKIKIVMTILLLISTAFSQTNAMLQQKITELEKRMRLLETRLLAVERGRGGPSVQKSSTPASRSVSTTGLITARLLTKKLDLHSGDNLALLVEFSNRSYKAITGFSGELTFTTRTGEKLLSFAVDINKVIPINDKVSWYGGVTYKASDRGQVRLLDMHVSTILVSMAVKKIFYADGTTNSF